MKKYKSQRHYKKLFAIFMSLSFVLFTSSVIFENCFISKDVSYLIVTNDAFNNEVELTPYSHRNFKTKEEYDEYFQYVYDDFISTNQLMLCYTSGDKGKINRGNYLEEQKTDYAPYQIYFYRVTNIRYKNKKIISPTSYITTATSILNKIKKGVDGLLGLIVVVFVLLSFNKIKRIHKSSIQNITLS